MIGQNTLSSKLLFWQAISMVLSLPRTCMQIISKHSAMEGFTLPGMMEEPGWTPGRVISEMPAFGPMFMILRSLQMFRVLTESERRAAEKFKKAFMLLAISVRFFPDSK